MTNEEKDKLVADLRHFRRRISLMDGPVEIDIDSDMKLLAEAADEIERLTAELAEERQMHAEVDAALCAEVDERDRLRAALERCYRWMNDRVGNTWEAHDAVDPTLWDELKALGIAREALAGGHCTDHKEFDPDCQDCDDARRKKE